jgi:hypothetical protein
VKTIYYLRNELLSFSTRLVRKAHHQGSAVKNVELEPSERTKWLSTFAFEEGVLSQLPDTMGPNQQGQL